MTRTNRTSYKNDGELPFTGLGQYVPYIIAAAALIYFGLILLSALPRARREERST